MGERVREFFTEGHWNLKTEGDGYLYRGTLETFCDRDGFWVLLCCGGEVVWKILVLWVKLNILIFCVFFVFWGVSLVRKIKRKLTEFLERSYRNSRFSWYRTILFWAGFVWVGSCTGWVEWELNQQSRVWGALVWGSSGAGSWELKGLLILFRDFLQIVSGDTVQGYYQTLSYIYTFGV